MAETRSTIRARGRVGEDRGLGGAHGIRGVVVLAVLAGVLFAGLAWYLRSVQAGLLDDAAWRAAEADRRVRAPAAAEVQRSVRALKLVTVELDTRVTAETTDQSWRGDVSARVSAPARFYYGTDLAGLEVESLRVGPLLESYAVRVPPPRRLAVEVFSGTEESDVKTGWLRLRSRAGEYYLGQARKGLHEAARATPLHEEDRARIRAATEEQIVLLVRALAGRPVNVRVTFDPGAGEGAGGTASAAEPAGSP
ncbi:MAG: DUF4230 domain-containing protein [Phycisphaerae bacterium]|nr:DUF4230 domain-containing protein [Phycisphaerae bacterium]